LANYVVGDIQGCYYALRSLLDKVGFDPAADKLWAVGDLIGRGPQALETLEFLYSLGPAFDTVLGNHDLHFLAVHCGIKADKKADKLSALLNSEDIDKYVNWLRHLPLALTITPDTLLTHAGLYPQWSFSQALAYSSEITRQLQGENWRVLLKHMYGSEPKTWHDTLSEFPRWRFIINAFTRMRFMQHNTGLEFSHKGTPEETDKDLTPWFKVPNNNLLEGQQVIFGHWAAVAGKTGDRRFIALDTGYVWGQQLTLVNLQNMHKTSFSHPES
jgi:bis(5'-nucleosyl)-tetraphosphatase (symmetrical)